MAVLHGSSKKGVEIVGGRCVDLRLEDVRHLENQVARAFVEDGAAVLAADLILGRDRFAQRYVKGYRQRLAASKEG